MNRTTRLYATIAAFVLAILFAPAIAHAQRSPRIGEQLALARIGASECGLRCTDFELAAIAEVLHARAARLGTDFEGAARAYSSRVFDTVRTDERAWVANVDASGREPRGWPTFVTRRGRDPERVRIVAHAPWGAFRARWLELYAMAGRVVHGSTASRCAEPVDHWGMRTGIDHERAVRAGWISVDCGPTRNAFWRVPRVEVDRD